MYKIITSNRDSDDSSIDFSRSIEARERESNTNKETKVNYHFTFYLKVVFGFAEDQYKCTYGLGYKLTLQGNSDNPVLSHLPGVEMQQILL